MTCLPLPVLHRGRVLYLFCNCLLLSSLVVLQPFLLVESFSTHRRSLSTTTAAIDINRLNLRSLTMSLTDSAEKGEEQQRQQKLQLELQQKRRTPKLIVFDLDNTLWTPELYELHRKFGKDDNNNKRNRSGRNRNEKNSKNDKIGEITSGMIPIKAGRDINLYPGAAQMINEIRNNMVEKNNNDDNNENERIQFAVASRTTHGDWAYEMLDQFNIRSLFDYIEIFPGNKVQHFQNIRKASKIQYHEMIFFDDARDGKYGNCLPVSQLGVLAVHCPNGINTYNIYETALQRYREWDQQPGTIIEWDGTISSSSNTTAWNQQFTTMNDASTIIHQQQSRVEGVIKMINYEKRYGFIKQQYVSKDVFFHFDDLPTKSNNGNNLVSNNIQKGDKIAFHSIQDHRTGKPKAIAIQIIHQSTSTTSTPTFTDKQSLRVKTNYDNKPDRTTSTSNDDDDLVILPAFSMNLPFAALLANGYKTLETRNGTMFVPYPVGTKMLLHVGQRIYPDGDKHIDIMKNCDGLNEQQIEQYKTLKSGFRKGMVVAIVEIGKTYETTTIQRNQQQMQRNIVAYGSDSGKMVTEIQRVEYLKQPINMKGQAGIFQVQVNKNIIPDGWIISNKNDSNNDNNYNQGTMNSKKPIYSLSG